MPRTRPEAETGSVAVAELGAVLGVESRVVMEYVELGFVGAGRRSALAANDVARLSRALRLARDLELHAAAAAMLVDLLDEREALRRRIARLERVTGARA
jgi:chaperone modulatory protein CbpM